MKKAILSVVSGEKFEKIWARTQSFFENYADKIGADLIVLNDANNVPSPHWIKFAIYEFLKKDYERIAFIDADILIRDDSPSLFDVVPEDEFGIFNEGQHTPRAMCLYEVMNAYKISLPTWNMRDYYNTGVMVVSREHRYVFRNVKDLKPLRNSFGEQTYINYRLFESEVKVHSLNYKFNSMSLMNRLTGISRLDSYFIHYAGWDSFNPPEKLFEDIDRDIQQWKEDAPEYKYTRNLFMFVGGGIGDQMCAEPVLRYMEEELYPDSDIYVLVPEPRLFEHLNVIASKSYPRTKIDAVHEMNAHPSRIDNISLQLQHLFCHGIDYVSTASLGRILPNDKKTFYLDYSKEELQESVDICDDLEDLILIHPGVGWESKTFPVEWWQEIVDGIDKVGIIGKTLLEDHSYLPVKCPENGFDFRDKLSLGGLIALLSKAKMVVSNDSAPIHLAGAFDNYIIVIPTCKHPDFILPFRKGDSKYKTAAIYNKLMHDDVRKGDLPTDLVPWIAKDLPNIKEYLPSPEEVLSKINEIYPQSKSNFSCAIKRGTNDSSLQSNR